MSNSIAIDSKKPPIIFVHGLCHGAWCWYKYKDFFEENGYECHAFDLRGHGEKETRGKDFHFWRFHFGRKTATRSNDYCTDLDNEVGKCATKPILIGHSMGGAVVQKYIDDKKHVDKIAAVVLLASVPRLPVGYDKSKSRSFYFQFFWEMLLSWGLLQHFYFHFLGKKSLFQPQHFLAVQNPNQYQKKS